MFIADLAEVMKGIRALAPNSPDIAVAIHSNQSLVDNYIKVSLQIQHGISSQSPQRQLMPYSVLSVVCHTACGHDKSKDTKLPLLFLTKSVVIVAALVLMENINTICTFSNQATSRP